LAVAVLSACARNAREGGERGRCGDLRALLREVERLGRTRCGAVAVAVAVAVTDPVAVAVTIQGPVVVAVTTHDVVTVPIQ
jgi:hypothetical protein